MRLSPNNPLAARATSAAKKPMTPLLDPYEVPVARKVIHPTWLELPYPASANSLYGIRVVWSPKLKKHIGVPYKTTEHRDYMDLVGGFVGTAVRPWPQEQPLAVSLRLFRPRRVGDIDNPLKPLLDALNGRAWADDSQIVELHVSRRDDKQRPRVEVSIQPAAPEVKP